MSSNWFFCLWIMSFESAAIIPLWHTALMNAFQPSLPCFSASHYQSVELISLLTAGAIMRLLSLISNSYSIPAVFFSNKDISPLWILVFVSWNHLYTSSDIYMVAVYFNQFGNCKPCLHCAIFDGKPSLCTGIFMVDFWLQCDGICLPCLLVVNT